MFQLYKKRNFSDFISDTITFFKIYGKHFFKNYLLINGGFLLVLCFLMYFIFKVYFEVVFSSIGTTNSDYFSQYFNSNSILFIGTLILFFLLIIIISMLNFAYPVLYLQFISKNPEANFTIKDITTALTKNTGRLLVFILGLVFIIFPLLMLLFTLLFLMIFIIIGLPLLLIAMPAVLAWINLSFYDYLTEKTGFFRAFKNGFLLLKQQFWTIVGTTFVMLMLIQIVQGIITMVPYFIGIIYFFSSGQTNMSDPESEGLATMGIFAAVIMILAVLLSYFFNNLVLINQGLIYYSLREENESTSLISNIDLIGADNE